MTGTTMNRRLHRLAEISLKQLRALDRDRTVVLLPVGMIEVHGDHLPLGTDLFAVESLALAAAAPLLEHDPERQVLLLPAIPYGTDPVDRRRPDLFGDAGSVWLSRDTLKAVIRDVAGHLVRYGFRFIFPVGFHGGADQSQALAEICTEMCQAHPGLVMVEPVGYVMAGAGLDSQPGLSTLLGRPLTDREQVMLQGSIHASMFETSMMLHLRPALVDPVYKTLRTIDWPQMYQMADWPGYVGAAPAHADAELGAAMLRWRGVRAAALIERALDGEDITRLPRHPASREDQAEAGSVSEAPSAPELPAHRAETPPSAQLATRTIRPGRTDQSATRPGSSSGKEER